MIVLAAQKECKYLKRFCWTLILAHDNGISTRTKHKTKTSIKFNLFPKKYYKNVKFSVFTLHCTKSTENYGGKLMHGVIKVKSINVGKTNVVQYWVKSIQKPKQIERTLQATC